MILGPKLGPIFRTTKSLLNCHPVFPLPSRRHSDGRETCSVAHAKTQTLLEYTVNASSANLVVAEPDVDLLNVGGSDAGQARNVADHLESPEHVDVAEALGVGQHREQERHDLVLGADRVRVQLEALQGVDDLQDNMRNFLLILVFLSTIKLNSNLELNLETKFWSRLWKMRTSKCCIVAISTKAFWTLEWRINACHVSWSVKKDRGNSSSRVYRGPDVGWLHGDVFDLALLRLVPRVAAVLDGVARFVHEFLLPRGGSPRRPPQAVGRRVDAFNLQKIFPFNFMEAGKVRTATEYLPGRWP